MERTRIAIYDTTLRDGAQQEGISLSVADKLRIVKALDKIGIAYVEGGWPGMGPKDSEFFTKAGELSLVNAQLCAFGATAKPHVPAASDPQVAALAGCCAPQVTLVAKADETHVQKALHTDLSENLRMVADTVAFLCSQGKQVMVDLEHCFDSLHRSDYALRVADTALRNGAHTVIACDTNGGTLPGQIFAHTKALVERFGDAVGIHAHNDSGCANANAVVAVEAGARQVQVTANGYGERTGNSNLFTTIANLELKMGCKTLADPTRLADLTHLSHRISEITNISPFARDPYVGASAFTHKGGLHASAMKVDPALYQHVNPEQVGNSRRMLVSEMSGRALVEMKAAELGIPATDPTLLRKVTNAVKEREARGYTYDAADASFALLVRYLQGNLPHYFEVESWHAQVLALAPNTATPGGRTRAKAEVSLTAGGAQVIRSCAGNGPVNALDHAFSGALAQFYPTVQKLKLIDFKVRILDEDHGSDATVRVLLEAAGPTGTWTTVGVGTDLIEASWEALADSYIYGLLEEGISPLE
ncbi:citramalate synthase [Winkia sp. UMB6473-AN360BR]|uniref:citramalate synthase n=1 Tax=Winkia sp. UMB6473-AN360BR TaxID=3050611 RepID=UPI0025555B44|nr:citramalate synthase [Winkia sp. UMB6473-AN360BR]MDK8817552.1 citramalate synthase [Winkia sp. UMB6473-AN360BR]